MPPGSAPLRAELIAAWDHDLRTSLTTVLGALQTMARPELAPDDPEVAALLSAALAQAQRMRRLLDELPSVVAAGEGAPLLPTEIADLIRRAGEMGGRRAANAAIPDDLGEVHLSAPGFLRALTGILARVGPGEAIQVIASRRGAECNFTITAGDGALLPVPESSARLVAAMGGRIEQAPSADSPAIRLIFPSG